jgi:hypothetical protein
VNLTNLEDFVKNLLAEDTVETGSSSALFTTAQLDDVINAANQKVYLEAVKASQSMFLARSSSLTFSSSTGYYDFSTAVDANGIYILTDVEFQYQSRWYQIELGTPNQRHDYEPQTIAMPQRFIPQIYYIEGEKIYFSPPPVSDQTFRISYVPNLPAMTASVVALGGKLIPFHRVVGYEAASMLGAKGSMKNTPLWQKEADTWLHEMRTHLSRRSTQRGRHIRIRPYPL